MREGISIEVSATDRADRGGSEQPAKARLGGRGSSWRPLLWEPELHRLGGDAWRLVPRCHREAEASSTSAIEVARRQGAHLAELRAATALARLWAARGDRGKAYDLLAPAYSWFTEGFDTVDVKDAKTLLSQLR